MIAREDRETNTVADAAAFEQARGAAYDPDPRPTRQEIEALEWDAEREGRR